jgi:hypothetical protein
MFYIKKLFILFINTILLLLFYQNNISCLSNDEKKLIFVLKLFSNGIITPETKNYVDVFQNYWPHSSELTNIGIRQIYLLGINDKYLYHNDSKLISDTFNPKEILIKSSNISYTIQSAYAYLHGIYPPGKGQNFQNGNISSYLFSNFKNLNPKDTIKINETINALNIYNTAIQSGVNIAPVYIFDKYEFQFNNNENCPHYVEMKTKSEENNKENFIAQIYNEFNNSYGDLFRNYFNKSEEFFQEPKNLMLYLKTYVLDYLIKGNDSSLSFNKNKSFTFDHLYNLSMNLIHEYYLNFEYDEEILYQITSSPILNSLFHYSDLRIEYIKDGKKDKIDSNIPKFVVYSGEISDLYALKKYLNETLYVEINDYTNFSSSINFEVYVENNVNKINISYDGNLVLNEKYEDFKNKISLLSEENITKFCKTSDNNDNEIKKKYTNYNVYLIWIFWIIIIIGLFSIFLKIKSYNELTNKIY